MGVIITLSLFPDGVIKENILQALLATTVLKYCIYFIINKVGKFCSSNIVFHNLDILIIFSFLLLELIGDVLKEEPKKLDGLDSIVIVDNVPAVGPDRLEKLKNVIRKIFTKFGKIVSEFYPEEEGSTKG